MNAPNLAMHAGRSPLLRVPLARMFEAEVRESRTLGFQLRIATMPATDAGPGGMIGARLDPVTDRARDALAANSLNDQGAAPVAGLEAIRPFADAGEQLDATRDAIRACLDLARTVTA